MPLRTVIFGSYQTCTALQQKKIKIRNDKPSYRNSSTQKKETK